MQQIKHLHWRAGFGLSPENWQERQHWSIPQAVDHLFAEADQDQAIKVAIADATEQLPQIFELMKMDKEDRRKDARKMLIVNNSDWIQMMAKGQGSSLKHRMMLFWHGHFACRITQPKLALQQLTVLEQHGLGYFRDLVLGIAKDPAMIRYLNNQQNRKRTPNENFARELMELFTIGRGHYTETDVKEAARAFTGWSSNREGEYVFVKFQHDFGTKNFLGKTGNLDGTDIIDRLLEQKETALFLTRKIYRYFVNEHLDEEKVAFLADQFYQSDYHIGKLMRTIFSSDWFYEPRNMGTQIKSPIVLLAGVLRSLPTEFANPTALRLVQKSLGQVLFNPPNVAGWPGGKNWIDNSTLLLRLNLPVFLLQAADADLSAKADLDTVQKQRRLRTLEAQIDLTVLEKWLGPVQPVQAARKLSEYLLVRPAKIPDLLESELARNGNTRRTLPMMLVGLMSLPEYQLC